MQRTHTWRQNTLRSRVQALRLAPPYLRHAPPSLYVTCDMQRESGAKTTLQRHSTRLLDSSIDDDATSTLPPHSHGSYMLSSTSFEDLQFRDASAITRAMVGLPKLHTVDQVRRFMEKHAEHLNNLTLVALPEVHPTTPMVLHTLLQAYPAATISCSAFGRALLSDETFFHGVKKAMIRNAHPSTAEGVSNTLTFAGIPADRITEVSGDAELPLGDAQGRRKLRAYPTPASNSKTGKNTLPAHFEPRRVVYFDTAFQCAHIGDAALRLPWMPRLLRECRADTILPSPHLLHVQYGDARTSPVLHHFDSMSSTASLISTLKRIPYTQRVCSSSFGEFPGDADSFGRALERSAVRLEELRSRLAKRLETDTSLDTRRWSAAVSRRLVEELLREQRSAEATEDDILQDIHHWAEDSNSPLGHLSCCLTASARALPPTTVTSEPTPPRASPKPAGQRPQVERESVGDDEEMEGAAGVQLLTSIFMKKNLAGLVKCLEKQEIDVPVFLSMSTQDFQKVFKATFGLSKKLELLQTELKQHIQSLRNERDGGQK